jgi:hypothetical protein
VFSHSFSLSFDLSLLPFLNGHPFTHARTKHTNTWTTQKQQCATALGGLSEWSDSGGEGNKGKMNSSSQLKVSSTGVSIKNVSGGLSATSTANDLSALATAPYPYPNQTLDTHRSNYSTDSGALLSPRKHSTESVKAPHLSPSFSTSAPLLTNLSGVVKTDGYAVGISAASLLGM